VHGDTILSLSSDNVASSRDKWITPLKMRDASVYFETSPPLTPPNSPTNGALRAALKRTLSMGPANAVPPYKPQHRPLVMPVASSSLESTPDVSAMPSSANLIAFDETDGEELKTTTTTAREKAFACLSRLPMLLALLYCFVCLLDFLTTSFRLMAGRAAGMCEQDHCKLMTGRNGAVKYGAIINGRQR
jgi:hypothetical protein